MNNERILKKAIEKAVKNGYKPTEFLEAWLIGKFAKPHQIDRINVSVLNWYYGYIFSHDFAKAFWGEEQVGWFGIKITAWRFNLMEMVLEEEPLKYLEKFL